MEATNTTPHAIVVCAQDGTPVATFEPSAPHSLRVDSVQGAPAPAKIGGVDVLCTTPPVFGAIAGDVPAAGAVLVSMLVGNAFRDKAAPEMHGRVFGPDTGPVKTAADGTKTGAVRDGDGKIVGTYNFVRYW